MSLKLALRAISKKVTSKAGKVLGSPLRAVEPAHSGGFRQSFDNGVVYWHASTGAAIVRGNIGVGYASRGAEGADPRTGRRRFGYPKSDEAMTPDNVPFQHFEFATLICTPGLGSVAVDNAHLLADDDPTLKSNKLGLPIGDTTDFATLRHTRYERGIVLSHAAVPQPFVLELHCGALLGKPVLIQPDAGAVLPFVFDLRLRQSFFEAIEQDFNQSGLGNILAAIAAAPLQLRQVGTNGLHKIDFDTVRRETIGPDVKLTLGPCKLKGPMPDRTLFSLSMHPVDVPGAEGRIFDVAPHVIYTRNSWSHFAIAHATDLHTSARYDRYPAIWRRLGNEQAIEAFSNPNDNFRNFVRWANHEHAKGRLDMVVATGDIVDFIFDGDMNPAGAGNFRFFERLVRGMAKSNDPSAARSEPLKVPIFMTFGNHDYRAHNFPLFFKFRVGANLITRVQREYRSFNLLEKDARDLQGGKQITLSEGNAKEIVRPSEMPAFVFSHLTAQTEYSRSIGDKHLLLMLDSGPDVGVTESIGDVILGATGLDDNFEAFLGGTPNSRGSRVDPAEAKGLIGQTQGLVIVGTHAPPLNNEGNEIPWFFRASARKKTDIKELRRLTRAFLHRHVPIPTGGGFAPATSKHPLETKWPSDKTDHFSSGKLSEVNATGTSRRKRNEWIDVFAGSDGARGVDLVLSGHIHKDVEVSLRRQNGKMQYICDFHTENREESYQTRETVGNSTVFVKVGAPDQQAVERRKREETHENKLIKFTEVTVPGNADTLATAPDKEAWWRRFRPLVIQTACLGPIDSNHRREGKQDPIHQGVRLIRVSQDVIDQITLVTVAEIERVVARLAMLPDDTINPGGVVAPVEEPEPRPFPGGGQGNAPGGGVVS